MQYAKTLLSVSLVLGSLHVQADTQTRAKDNPMAAAPSPERQAAHSNDTNAIAQVAKNAKAPATRSPSRTPIQNPPYEIPLSDYNNGGHFGN